MDNLTIPDNTAYAEGYAPQTRHSGQSEESYPFM